MSRIMYRYLIVIVSALLSAACARESVRTYQGSDHNILFVGRSLSTSDSLGPRQWTAGSYFAFAFDGNECTVNILDEQIWDGNGFNYLELVVDGVNTRVCIDSTFNALVLDSLLSDAPSHEVLVCKDTESSHGYIQLHSVITKNLRPTAMLSECSPLIEYIGNSITCGAEAYCDEVPYGTGRWGDRHRAYLAYGPRVSRMLGARWMLTSVSGIGLIHSCCDMDIVMPQVYDKISLRDNKYEYSFSEPADIVCICLGQNDGVQDSTEFCSAYVDFISKVRSHNPSARIVMLSSPMADENLRAWQEKMLLSIEANADSVEHFFFSKQWNSGGGDHPDYNEHAAIANELYNYLK
ncbi:MAG: acetyl xylan esterase [Bacteroidia bacterium]|nr:acetyl xylan esterase [Bacteroidia bacterium]